MISTGKIVAVDVCGTLFDANTTAGFVRYFFKRGGRRKPLRFTMLEAARRIAPLRMALILLGKLVHRDLFRTGYIASLYGYERKILEQAASNYASALEEYRIGPVWDHLAELQQRGYRPILASNSLDIVIAAIADRNGWDWIASELGFRDGCCTGRLALDLKGAKARRLLEHLGEAGRDTQLAVVTDNRSDADLIALCDEATIVAKGRRRSWMERSNGWIIDLPA